MHKPVHCSLKQNNYCIKPDCIKIWTPELLSDLVFLRIVTLTYAPSQLVASLESSPKSQTAKHKSILRSKMSRLESSPKSQTANHKTILRSKISSIESSWRIAD